MSPDILAASADFHEEEATSYARFARTARLVIGQNKVSGRPVTDDTVISFLRGAEVRLSA